MIVTNENFIVIHLFLSLIHVSEFDMHQYLETGSYCELVNVRVCNPFPNGQYFKSAVHLYIVLVNISWIAS